MQRVVLWAEMALLLCCTGESCRHWVRHCEAMEARGQWAQKLVTEFQSTMEKWHEESGLKPPWPLGVDSPFRRKAGGCVSRRTVRGLLPLSFE